MEDLVMKEREELKRLISEMDNTQLEWFISQMRLLLFEEADEPDRQKAYQQNHA